ncbi:unnamed protein product [Sphagnum troendelagicum]|uniref:Uncharacterized protein n=1 Tax=Sphagnum troendelagicum TaxID=128251 RepID=A0ABP0UDB8_9BRYO
MVESARGLQEVKETSAQSISSPVAISDVAVGVSWRAESHTWRDDSKGSAGELAALQHAESQEEGTG